MEGKKKSLEINGNSQRKKFPLIEEKSFTQSFFIKKKILKKIFRNSLLKKKFNSFLKKVRK